MATIDQYKINVDVTGEQAVNRLRDSIGGLGSVIAGIGFGAFTAGVFRMADAVSDLADATGLAVGEVAAFQKAMALAGGDAEMAGKALIKFYNTLEEAANGGDKAQDALAKVGIGLNELRTLSEGELLAKALDSLSKMDAGAQRTALGMELLGKSFAMIDPTKFQEILKTQDVQALQDELNRIGQINDNIQASFMELQMAAINAFSLVLGPIDNFKLSAKQAEVIVKTVGAALAIAFGASVVRNVITLVGALGTLVKALRATAIAQAAVTALSGPVGWAALAGAAAAAGAAIYGIDKALGDANKETVALGNSAKKTFGQMNAGKGGAFANATGMSKQQAEARAKEALAAKQVTDQMIRQNEEANKLRQTSIDLIGVESDRANLLKSNAQAEADSRNKIADLDAKIVAERAKGKDANAAVIVELEKQKGIVSGQLQETLNLNQAEYQRLQTQKQIAINQQMQLEYNRQLTAEFNYQAQTQILLLRAQGKLTKDQIDGAQQVTEEFLKYDGVMNDLRTQLRIATENQNNIEVARIHELMRLEDERYGRTLDLIKERQAAEEALRQSSIAGIGDAMSQIAKQFEPYKMAQDAVLMGWNKIGSAIDDFVETGKFKFKDFARSVIQDLLKMIIKAQMFKAIQATLGVFGFKIPGLAVGGPAKAGQPYIVGEKGPELFVPKSAGTVIPNNKLAAQTQATGSGMVNAPITNNYITNNISAVDAKSVAQLFAENRKTLLGTVQMAQKEMPYGV